MKKIIYASLAAFVLLAFSSAVLKNGGSPGGKTGSPGDGANCTQCHTDFAAQNLPIMPVTITGLDTAVGYTPGQTYSITLIAADSTSNKFGFEFTAEDTSNAKVGTFTITDAANTQLTNSNNAVTHTAAGNAGTANMRSWSFDWTAPAAGTGNVTFYAAQNITNSSMSTSGDVIKLSSMKVKENVTSANSKKLLDAALVTVYPNPAADFMKINSTTNEVMSATIFDINAQVIKTVETVENGTIVDLSTLETGTYFVHFNSEKGSIIKKIIKK